MSLQLFPDDPKFSSTNWVPINKDASVWDAEITTKVKKVVPADNIDISVIWNTKDENKGYGLGSAVVVAKRGKSRFIIPVIVKEFKLAPLDVMITNSKAMRLTEENAEESLFSGGIGDMSSRDASNGIIGSDPNGWMPNDFSDYSRAEVTYQKSSGIKLDLAILNGNWGILKRASEDGSDPIFTDYVNAWSSVEGLERAKQSLSDPGVMNKYAEGDKQIFVEFMNDISTDQVKKEKRDGSAVESSCHDPMPPGRKIEVVKKVGPDAYVMLSSSIENFAPAMDLKDGENVRVILTSQLKNEGAVDAVVAALEAAGTSGVTVPWPKDDEDVVLGTQEAIGGDKWGVYDAYDQASNPARGVLFTRVMDANGDVKDRKVFLTSAGGGKQNPSFAPKPVPLAEPTLYNEDLLEIRDAPSAGDYGYLILKDLLIGPFDIMSMSKDRWTDTEYRANIATADGSTKVLSTSEYIQGVSVSKNGLRVSDKFKWANVSNIKKYVTAPALKKEASVYYDRGRYTLSGFGVPAEWSTNLKEAEAKFTLASHGLGIQKISQALLMAKQAGSVDIAGLKGQRQIEKSASSAWSDRAWEKFSQQFDHGDHDFVKLASMFDRLDTVDKVLGLNFISKANIARFVSAIPLLKDALEELVRLLVVSRIGATEVPEEAISQTIDSMSEVIDGLESLSLHEEDENAA